MRYDAAQINRFDLTRYPDYRGDFPPDVYQLHRFGHLEEYEAEWGRRWGANGIGRLRDVALSRPPEYARGVCELGRMALPIAEDTWIAGTSNCATAEGWAQVRPTLEEAGIRHLVPMPLQIIRDEFDNGGEFHTDMVIAAVKERTVLIYPAFTPWGTYHWLRDHEFTIIEVPREEHQRFTPEDLLIVEPGKAIVDSRAPQTI